MGEHGQFHIADIILRASRQAGDANVYSLGPYVGRISFLSQQYRAYNLVWALHERSQIGPGTQVAVIGAGLSGLTAAAAALAFGADVTVYEQADREIPRQRNTKTRFIHPRINWWPHKHSDHLNPTTALPMLNWQSDICEEVSKTVLEEWAALKLMYGPGRHVNTLRVEGGRLYKTAKKPPYAKQKTVVEFDRRRETEHVDLVILAIGFSVERDIDGKSTMEYWDNDNLEGDREKGVHQVYVVSGFGDGGLIDALRLIYDFDWGRLAYRLALALYGTTIEAELAKLTDGGASRADALTRYRELVEKIVAAHAALGSGSLDPDLREEYVHLGRAWDIVEAAVRPRSDVHIVDHLLDHPVFGEAAPLYKLMIAMAEWRDLVTVHRGVVEIDSKKSSRSVSAERPITIRFADGRHLSLGTTRSTRIVVRHGAEWEIRQFVPPEELAQMQKEAANLLEHNYNPAWDSSFAYPTARGYACVRRDMPGFIRQYGPKAKSALKAIASSGIISSRLDRFCVFDHDIRYRPKHLFGVAIDYKSFEDIAEAELDG